MTHITSHLATQVVVKQLITKCTFGHMQTKISKLCLQCRSRDPSGSFPEEEGDSTVEVKVQPPYPFNQSLVSSEESEDDEQEEGAYQPAASWHPKPLGVSEGTYRSTASVT